MSNFYIYGLFEKSKDKKLDNCFYIGKGVGNRTNIHFRKSHLKKCNNKHKVHKIKKIQHKRNKSLYSRKIITGLDEKRAYNLEEKIIKEIKLENLTNLASGGKGPPTLKGENHPLYDKERSEEVKEIVRRKNTGKSHHYFGVTGEDHPQYGRNLKPKTKEKISKSSRGRNTVYSKKIASNIKWLLKNTNGTHSEISSLLDVPEHLVSSISKENSWAYIEPTKKENVQKLEKFKRDKEKEIERKREKLREIKWYGLYTKRKYESIGKDYNKSKSAVSHIVNGFGPYNKNLKPKRPKKVDVKTYENPVDRKGKLSEKNVSHIKWKALNTNKTNKEISSEYNISPSLVSRIKTGKRWGYVQPKMKK